MKLFFMNEQNEAIEEEEIPIIEPIQIPTNTQLPNKSSNGLRRSSRTKRKTVSDLDNYKIVHRANMITYQERSKRHKQKNKSEGHAMTPLQRFKRRQSTPPPTAPSSNTNTPNQKNDDPHKNKKHKRNPA